MLVVQACSPLIPSIAPRERLLSLAVTSLALSVVVVGAGLAASASLARRLRSASLLLLATRPGFLAVTRAGVGAGVGVGASGIVSSCCEVMVSILKCQISFRFLSDSCQVSHFNNSFEWITFFISARMCCRFGLRFLLKLHVFGRDEGCIGQGQPAPTTQSNATRQRGELVVDDVVVLEVLMQLLDIINLHHQAHAFADEHKEGVDQRLGGFAPDISFLTFVELLHLLIRQAFDLFVCELNADDLFGLASRNKDGQLLAFGGNVVARCETGEP